MDLIREQLPLCVGDSNKGCLTSLVIPHACVATVEENVSAVMYMNTHVLTNLSIAVTHDQKFAYTYGM